MAMNTTAEQNELEAQYCATLRTHTAHEAFDALDSILDLTRKIRLLRGPAAETRDQRFMFEAEEDLLYRVLGTLARIAERP